MNLDSPEVVHVRDLSVSFGNRTVLSINDFVIKKGEAVAIVGPSGGGKSTLLRSLVLLEEPDADSGEIRIGHASVTLFGERKKYLMARRSQVKAIRREVGIVFQQYNLWPHMTVLENSILGPMRVLGKSRAEACADVMSLLARVHIEERADAYPGTMSGGEQQRAAIVRALALRPQVMLFDEVTSALDPELSAEVLDVMTELHAEGMSMAIVTHEIGFARQVADRVVFMGGGSIIADGTPEEVMDKPSDPRAKDFFRRVSRYE